MEKLKTMGTETSESLPTSLHFWSATAMGTKGTEANTACS